MKKLLLLLLVLLSTRAFAQDVTAQNLVVNGTSQFSSLTGYMFANGSAAATASATIPSTVLNYGAGITALSGVSIPVSLFGEAPGASYFSGGGISVTDNSTHAGVGHTAYSFSSSPLGTGAIGAVNADFGFTVSLLKQNFGSVNAHAGELDGGYFVVRNDGSNSDTTGFLVDVGNYGIGFNAAFESNTNAISGNAVVQAVDNQAGVVDTRTGNQYGYVVQKTIGTGGVAYYAAQDQGQWQHLLQFVGSGNIRFDMPIDSNNVASIKMFDASNNSKTIRVSSNQLSVLNNAGTSQIFALDDVGNLSVGSSLTTGNASINGSLYKGASGWTAYTPTLTATSGAYANASATGKYRDIGGVVFVHITITITSVGTGTNPIVTLPFAPIADGGFQFYGRETASTGKSVTGTMDLSGHITCWFNDNSAPAGNGYVINLVGFYVQD